MKYVSHTMILHIQQGFHIVYLHIKIIYCLAWKYDEMKEIKQPYIVILNEGWAHKNTFASTRTHTHFEMVLYSITKITPIKLKG